MTSFLRCNETNVPEFNGRLRAECPEAFELAKALHKARMIDGLRGASIGPHPSPEQDGVCPVLSDEVETRLADLRWQRRQQGAA